MTIYETYNYVLAPFQVLGDYNRKVNLFVKATFQVLNLKDTRLVQET